MNPLIALSLALITCGALLVWVGTRAYHPPRHITIDVPPYGPGLTIRPTGAPSSPHPAGITQLSIMLAAIAEARSSGGSATITPAAITRLRLLCGRHVLAHLGIDP